MSDPISASSVGEIAISPLLATDARPFLALRQRIESEAPHLPASPGERRESIFHFWARMFLHRNRNVTLVAKDRGEILGYITVVFPILKKFRNNAYIVLAVAKSARGRGIGSKLIEAAEKTALARKRTRVELEVFAKNTRAIELYKRLGYEVEGFKKGAIRDESGPDDIVFMVKWLA